MCFTLKYLKLIVGDCFYLSFHHSVCASDVFTKKSQGQSWGLVQPCSWEPLFSTSTPPSQWRYKSSEANLVNWRHETFCCWEQSLFPEKWLAEGMEILRESGKLVFQWVFMCRLTSLEEAEEEGGERGGEDSSSDTLPTTGGPEARQRRGTAGGQGYGASPPQGCARQRWASISRENQLPVLSWTVCAQCV